MSAHALVDGALDGDERAWRVLCDRHRGEVRAVALARLRDEHAAEDVVQEALLRAWSRLHQLDDPTRFGAWLKTIAARVAVDHLRARRPTATLAEVTERPVVLAPLEDHVVEREEAAVLHARLAELRDADRTALWERDALGASIPEVAERLGMTVGSVRVLLTRARGKVRDGYGLVAAPLLGLTARLRARSAGLGEAGAVAVVAPVVVVLAVAGVALPSRSEPVQAPDTRPTVATAPEPVIGAEDVTPDPVAATSSDAAPGATGNDHVATPARSVEAPPETRARSATIAGNGVVIGGPAPDQEPDGETTAPNPIPVEGVEVYLEELAPAGLENSCLVCGDE